MEFPVMLFEEIISRLPEGIIIMDKARTILFMNESAQNMTGWKKGERVPYCAYCQQRMTSTDEDFCIMTADDPIPFFYSNLAVSSGEEKFEMSLKKIMHEKEKFFFLRLSRPVKNENSEKAKFHELLVQETMLAQEAERKRIARELHDHIGQSVYSIFLGLEGIRNHLDHERYENHLDNMVNVMDRTLSDIKRMTKSLRPDTLNHLGIKDALREAVVDWMELYRIEIELELDIEGEEHFDREKIFQFFRILQEGVRNAVMHGEASQISIELKSFGSQVFFYIYDNGKGFDTLIGKSGGLGLRHMYERSRILGGDIRWSSKEGGPTKVDGYVSIEKVDGG
ncbi:sensor histidine kinase [Mesobacillus zeae]|uniref:histidine kinase n=1 Tax=Mesobacillus zeae TaxID=1917180 RepID=A0A398BFQ2_9BACI|nr:histidine kinase [Mesobacillus zeae]RID88081.1 PAS domain-containing protein [Mesobacillus zeae]